LEFSSEKSGKGCCLPLPRGVSGFQLAQTIGQQPQGAIQADAVIDAPHGARGLAATIGGAGGTGRP